MIVVTLGTEQYPFDSLLDWINILIKYKFIKESEEVIIQYGSSNQEKIENFRQVKSYDFLPEEMFKEYLNRARIVIGHCGEGTFILLNSLRKPYILVPRTRRFGEHVDDHQLEMAEFLETLGVPIARSPTDLVKFIREPIVPNFIVQEDDNHWKRLLNYYNLQESKKIMLVCSSGGHFKAMQELKLFWEQFEDICWVTFKTETTESAINIGKWCAYWAYSPTNRNLYNLVRNLFLAGIVLLKEKPDLIVSTGAGVAVPFFLLSKLLCKSQTLFIESKTRIKTLSLSAKILQKLSVIDRLVVQNEDLLNSCQGENLNSMGNYYTNEVTENKNDYSEKIEVLIEKENILIILPEIVNIKETNFIQEQINPVKPKDVKRIIIDMSKVAFFDSLAIRDLYVISGQSNDKKLQLILWGISPQVSKLLNPKTFQYYFIVDNETLTTRSKIRSSLSLEKWSFKSKLSEKHDRVYRDEKVKMLNAYIHNISMPEALVTIKKGIVLTVNVGHLMQFQSNQEFLSAYHAADYRLCDSQLMVYASKFLATPLKEKLQAIDLFPAFCNYHKDDEDIRIFLLGTDSSVAQKAKTRINSRICRQIVVAEYSPPWGFENHEEECQKIIQLINDSKATVLVVGAKTPKQELLINQHFINKKKEKLTNIKIIMSIGLTLDFEAGNIQRAPKWVRQIGLEWLYQLFSDPKRLWKRYLVENLIFSWLILKQKFNLYKVPSE
ncbi:WecB/TagA/CpsF family glycosyltransferase [Coleofasciculus sp.]|uniref:WecB/TagA/CpsF family glycosyltransferase n=1 Tax=Coleofasciculus sp. TaxID=3100458 RepID=UPI0039F87D19